ncbi:hypothetical protein ACFYKX_10305 [Cytobacillus sp. FJAT-54145]|uniref:Uncharacterized protein n=1 Tax=Cytobacillus spartinae TaxID=3299023 RepID=A0ABW6K9W3_9BACI
MHYEAKSTVSFRLPPDVTEEQLLTINEKKEQLGKGFSKWAAGTFLQGVEQSKSRDVLVLPLSPRLSPKAKDWLKSEQTLHLLEAWVEHIALDPAQAFAGSTPSSVMPVGKKEEQIVTFTPKSEHGASVLKNVLMDDDDE